MAWFLEGVCILPTFLVLWSSCTFVVNYLIAIFKRDVDVVFPFISDTGATPPESCIFGLMATISAFAGFTTMFARYKFVENLIERTGGVSPHLNKTALVIAAISCIGMCFVATFQETEVVVVHDFGALTFFIFGVAYIILQTVISYKAHPYGSSKRMCHVRAIFSVVACLAVIPTLACAAFLQTNKLHWNSEDKGYTLHAVSSVSEWIAAFTFVFFFFTYIQEFKKFTLKVSINIQEFT